MSSPSDRALKIEPTDEGVDLVRSGPCSFRLDSGPGPAATSRWSFFGSDPSAVVESVGGRASLWREGRWTERDTDPLDLVWEMLEEGRQEPVRDGPPFPGGAVGWLSYDLGRRWAGLKSASRADPVVPELCFAFFDTVFAHDLQTGNRFKATPRTGQRDVAPAPFIARPQDGSPIDSDRPISACQISSELHASAVKRALEYIRAGDVYQVNLSQRFTRPIRASSWDLYRALQKINPAPFSAFLASGDLAVISSSPERFLKFDAGTRRVETRPIKGTRPRSREPGVDRSLAEELMSSEKDRAENLMIVDVHRNDLGRVCVPGSVRTTLLRGLESYATVHHLVSAVEGRLREDRTPIDLLRAMFPAGSITGAPKLRAMEIIEELETTPRGLYTGAIGYIGWDGSMDFSVAIRTMVASGSMVSYGVGGGIVADSDPESEHREMLDKAAAMEAALDLVNG